MTDENINETARNGKEPAGDSIADNIVTLTKVTTPLLAKAVAHIMTKIFSNSQKLLFQARKRSLWLKRKQS